MTEVRDADGSLHRHSDGADFGAWLFKCNPRLRDFARFLSELDGVTEWCASRSYRTTLIRSGQPVMLWVSGTDAGGPTPGIWALGHTVGDASTGDADHTGASPSNLRPGDISVQLRLRLLDEPVPRALLRDVVELQGLEVLRIPAGSNPSWVTRSEFAALLAIVGSNPPDVRLA